MPGIPNTPEEYLEAQRSADLHQRALENAFRGNQAQWSNIPPWEALPEMATTRPRASHVSITLEDLMMQNGHNSAQAEDLLINPIHLFQGAPIQPVSIQAVPIPVASPPPKQGKHKFPVGTVVKWNFKFPGIKDYLLRGGHSIEQPFAKIIAYYHNTNIIKDLQCFGEVEILKDRHFEVNHFTEASLAEQAQFETALKELCACETRPPIGTALEFIGRNPSLKGKRGVVIGEMREKDKVLFHWFNNIRRDEPVDFSLFRIATSQTHSFKPDLTTYCECNYCHSVRPPDNVEKTSYKEQNFVFCNVDCAVLSGFNLCSCCMELVFIEGLNQTTDGNVCLSCFEAVYKECEECNRFFNSQLMTSVVIDTEHGEEAVYHCRYCQELGRRLIHDHSYRPHFHFTKMVWENTRYLGIELEVEVAGGSTRKSKMADMIKVWLSQQGNTLDVVKDGKVVKGHPLSKLVYIKSDGSLENGLEIVFHPFTLKSFHKNFPLKNFLTFLEENGALARHNCGMHVHVSKDRLKDLDLVKGKWFFHKCEPLLKRFSDREHFDFCRFEGHRPHANPYSQDYGHYSVFNTHSRDAKTLEIRLFNATLDYKKFLANLQFSDVFVDYIQHGPGAVFLRRQNNNIIWQDFIEYAKAQNRYQVLTSWILQKRIV